MRKSVLDLFLGITAIGETRNVGNGGEEKGPATLPKSISFCILTLAIFANSPTISLDSISKG